MRRDGAHVVDGLADDDDRADDDDCVDDDDRVGPAAGADRLHEDDFVGAKPADVRVESCPG